MTFEEACLMKVFSMKLLSLLNTGEDNNAVKCIIEKYANLSDFELTLSKVKIS